MFRDLNQLWEFSYFVREQLTRVMQSMTTLVGLSLAASVVGCDASRPTRPAPPGAPTALVFTTPEVQQTTPMEFPDPCTGEMVQGTVEARFTFDVDDQTPHITEHMKFRFSGNGFAVVTDVFGNSLRQLTATSYNGSGVHNEEFNDNLNSDKFESTTTDDLRIFATNSLKGEAMDDFTMHVNTHVTMFFVPLPPRITAQVTNVSMDCK